MASSEREEVLAAFQDGDTETRVRAARRLAEIATAEDTAVIRQLAASEPQRQVRNLLRYVLDEISQPPTETPEIRAVDLQRVATKRLASIFLHELNPLVGRLELEASRAIRGYPDSESARLVARIKSFLRAVRKLQDASALPDLAETNLTTLISDVVAEFAGEGAVRILLARDDPVAVVTDPSLVSLALVNGIRNAVEAYEGLDRDNPGVTVNWGVTDRDVWVSVLDDGLGVGGDALRWLEPSRSTKSNMTHSGMGLFIASRAMEGLGGTVRLLPRDPHGSRFEIRWPRGLP
jgi:signal transduction histidine kinase